METRCFVQLGCLGLVLVPIIAGNMPVVVLSYLAFMMLVAACLSCLDAELENSQTGHLQNPICFRNRISYCHGLCADGELQ